LETRPTFDTPLYAQSGNDLIGIPKSFDWYWTINYQIPKLVKSGSVSVSAIVQIPKLVKSGSVSVSAIVQFPWGKNTSSSSLTGWWYTYPSETY